MPGHIHPVAPCAPRVLLPGDPGIAMEIAIELLGDGKLMFNHNHGLWGYTGTASDGGKLTIQSTGIGGPSAAAVLEDLAQLGVREAVVLGTCASLTSELPVGTVVAASALLALDGVGSALASAGSISAGDLAGKLAGAADASGLLVSTDLVHDPEWEANRRAWAGDGAVALDHSAAALAAVATRREIRFGCLSVVERGGAEMDHGARRTAFVRMAAMGLDALSDT